MYAPELTATRNTCRLTLILRLAPTQLEHCGPRRIQQIHWWDSRPQFRELLERLLDDDDDMRDLNLTAKCAC